MKIGLNLNKNAVLITTGASKEACILK